MTEPWEAFIERLVSAVILAHPEEAKLGFAGAERLFHWPDGVPFGEPATPEHGFDLSKMLSRAQTFFWKGEIVDALRAAPPHPSCELRRPVFPFPYCYFTYDVCYGRDDKVWDWEFYGEHEAGLISARISVDPRNRDSARLVAFTIPWGSRINNRQPDGPAEFNFFEMILRMAAFLRSPCVQATPIGIPRGLRRASKAREELDEVRISVVTLRRMSVRGQEADSRSIDWKHRWWVSGHYRNQFFPSTDRHEFVWIAPYIKGPEDRPFLDKVFSVVR